MTANSKKGKVPRHEVDEATKKEVQRLLGIQPDSATRLSGLSVFFKISSGYLAMAIFTMAALLFSAYHLYSINRTAFTIAKVHLPVLSAVGKMRASLIAQEAFAGKYAILKDPAFAQLFRGRDQESRRNLSVLEAVGPAQEIEAVKRQYLDYQAIAGNLFSGREGSSDQVNSAANGVIEALDSLYVRRQQLLQRVLERADEQRISTIGWTVVISGAGFLLALVVSVVVTLRILKSLRKVERLTLPTPAASYLEGEKQRSGGIPGMACETQMSARLKDLEQRSFTTSGEIIGDDREPSPASEQANR